MKNVVDSQRMTNAIIDKKLSELESKEIETICENYRDFCEMIEMDTGTINQAIIDALNAFNNTVKEPERWIKLIETLMASAKAHATDVTYSPLQLSLYDTLATPRIRALTRYLKRQEMFQMLDVTRAY